MNVWHYRRVHRDNDHPSFIVYVDDRYMGEVYLMQGGWAFYNADRRITSVATSRDNAVRIGLGL